MIATYYQVSSIDEALQIIDEHKDNVKVVAGATDLWLEQKAGIHKGIKYLVDISRISGQDSIFVTDNETIHLGPLVTHSHCVRSELIRESATCLYEACLSVGSPQIRNRGTVAGNVFTASPANDTISALMALDAKIAVKSMNGTREILITELYTGVRKNTIKKDELITDIHFSKLDNRKSFSFFVKQGLRKAQAISIMNVSVVCIFSASRKIEEMRIAFGSLAPTVVRAKSAETYAKGLDLDKLDLNVLCQKAVESISPITDLRSTDDYRKRMAKVLLTRTLEKKINTKNVDQTQLREVTLWGKESSTFHPITTSHITSESSKIKFKLNGHFTEIDCIPGRTVLDVIRDQTGNKGSKEGCGEGECGACTIFMDGIAVLACLIPAQRAEGTTIETIEFLSSGNRISNLQESFIEENAVQCGFCTPGFIMSATKLLEEITNPNEVEIKTAISGNLCRCTGYYKIIKAIERAAEMS
jgi:xanthine dehydrogenase iron-sulfur cluster and FAD-binding subunit A